MFDWFNLLTLLPWRWWLAVMSFLALGVLAIGYWATHS